MYEAGSRYNTKKGGKVGPFTIGPSTGNLFFIPKEGGSKLFVWHPKTGEPVMPFGETASEYGALTTEVAE